MAGKMTATQKKTLDRRTKTSILMADRKTKEEIAEETGVTVRTVSRDVQWVIDNPAETKAAGGKAPSRKTVEFYSGKASTKRRSKSSEDAAGARVDHGSDSLGGSSAEDASTDASGSLADGESQDGAAVEAGFAVDLNTTPSQLVTDVDASASTPDRTEDPAGDDGTVPDMDVKSGLDEDVDDDGDLGGVVVEGTITEEIPAMDATDGGGIPMNAGTVTSDLNDGAGEDSPAGGAGRGADDGVDQGVDGEDPDADPVLSEDDDVNGVEVSDSSSVVMVGGQAGNGLISVDVTPVKSTKTVTEVVSLDTPDVFDPMVRERLEKSRPLLRLPEDEDDDLITYHTRKITNLVRDGVVNGDDESSKEPLGKAFKIVWSEVFGHKPVEDGLEDWFQEWDEDVSLTDEEMAFQDLSHRMKTEYMKVRIREDRVMIVFIGLVAVLLVASTLLAVGFNMFG